ncbi:MAG: Regulator of RpoS [Verrucomicrobiae bacterium]|nr:Regulator of RpoS [Verrucomicrobiae bacterium]
MKPIPLLLVEDNPIYAEVLQRLLPSLGTDLKFVVTWVDSAERALETVKQHRFELVLLDYRLPTGDGLTVLDFIRTQPATEQPAVIMLTGMGREEIAVEAMKRGAKDYLSKDHLDVASLLRAITSALERRHLEEQLARYTEELRHRNAQFETDLNMAREIQEAFLPSSFPTFPAGVAPEQSALRFDHRYLPTTTVGGDYFDVLTLPGNRAGVFICDVMGHGVRAALVMAYLRALAEELGPVALDDPGRFLTDMNRRLLRILKRTRMPMFASAFYLVADPQAGLMHYAGAGHPIPLHVHRHQAEVAPLSFGAEKPGPALGVFEGTQFAVASAPMAAGDLVVLYTDGLFEVTDSTNQEYGESRLIQALQQRAHMQTAALFGDLLDEVYHFSSRRVFTDDVCLLGMDVLRVGV